ncbi:hypothetical protein KP509_26G023700 [Ceratopteris richardii]|uniref:FAD/NAD(P)-binding domain-containing protein n=1 Tax=Ceratopteris richardii TaxID=49495 RepID=A0A8T2RJ85_CERRI|nr:hypothetical protein KP509_26G023700 [Ceratopteris richardii]
MRRVAHRQVCRNVSSFMSTEVGSGSSRSQGSAYQWCVVGAGPAGIATVGLLLDSSVPPASLLWVDPSFTVGDFGTRWKFVSSNTNVGLFLRFYQRCRSFDFPFDCFSGSLGRTYAIQDLPKEQTCPLDVASEPLRDATQNLRKKVHSVVGEVSQLREREAKWQCILSTSSGDAPSFLASNVVLATGAVPRSLHLHKSYPSLQEISVTTALNPSSLVASLTPDDTVAIFGSSHTAIIILRTLLEKTCVKKVINFYRRPLRYALYIGDWIIFDDTGLKGDTARWSRENLHGSLPDRLKRVYSDSKMVQEYLPLCTKVIYAVGFERRQLPFGILEFSPGYSYNTRCGIIAPGLFGCGIGYPEEKTDRYGNVEARVGLWKFMEHLESVIPIWKEYSVSQGIGQPKGISGRY